MASFSGILPKVSQHSPGVFHANILDLDCSAAAAWIEQTIRDQVGRELRKRGVVVGVSGGVDSAVCVTLAARALGPERVQALLMPGKNTTPSNTELGRRICDGLGVRYAVEPIGPAIEALGGYRRRDEAIRKLYPGYVPGDKYKIAVADDVLGHDRLNYFNLVLQCADGALVKERMPLDVYLAIVAATNLKQRTRKMLEYLYADTLNYAVIGTPNRLEFDQGFFVRGGDGLADIKPIAHLYKTQVYALARFLGVPRQVTDQPPTTDTYSLPQTQEEFYFALPYDTMDMLLYAFTHDVSPAQAGQVLGLRPEQVERAYRDIVAKRRMSRQLHQHALTVEPVNIGDHRP
jgi:NAD+ synthase